MKANELRIGNLVFGRNYLSIEDEIMIVKQIDEIGINMQPDGLFQSLIKNLKAIPLSEEILLKAGFEKTNWDLGTTLFFLEEYDSFEIIKNNGKFMLEFGGRELFPIKYLHTLQNAFYCLSEGKELEIKL